MTIIGVTITKHKKLWEFSWCKMSKGKHCSSDKHSIWSREPASEQFIHSLKIKVRSSHLKHPTSEDDFFFFERRTARILPSIHSINMQFYGGERIIDRK